MSDLLQTLVTINVPPEVWTIIVSGLGLSALQTKFNKWFHLQSDKIKVTLTGVLSLIAATIPVYLDMLAADPTLLGAYSASTFAAMTIAYRFVVKPVQNLLIDARTYRATSTVQPVVDDVEVSKVQQQVITSPIIEDFSE